MHNKIVLLMLALGATMSTHAQTGIQWERNFGGTETDFGHVVKATTDGGYILGGYSYSHVSGTKSSANYGLGDFWVVKLDASGNKQWDKSFGGTSFDGIKALQQTSDGGHVLGGISFSDSSGNKSSANYGVGDYWVVKLDANGNKQWEKSYGGNENDELHAVQQTSDGGYVLGGFSFSGVSGNKNSASLGDGTSDFWLVKLDANGSKQWEKSYGGNQSDELHAVQQTSDGGYVLGGFSFSGVSGNKSSASLGNGTSDYWVLKLDANGNKQWDKSYGGDDAEELYAVQQTTDGGYILGGHSYSGVSGNKTSGSFGSHDYWVVKLDSSGNKQWDKSYGGDGADELHSVQQTSEGGYILGGVSSSGISGNKMSTSSGSDSGDYWIVNLDPNGNKQSEQCIRGSYFGEVLRLQQSRDGGSVLAGLSTSLISGDMDYGLLKWIAPLRFNSFSLRPDNMFQTRFIGTPGMNYVLQTSTDLIHWNPVLTTSSPDGVITFAGANVTTSPLRFYRVQQQP